MNCHSRTLAPMIIVPFLALLLLTGFGVQCSASLFASSGSTEDVAAGETNAPADSLKESKSISVAATAICRGVSERQPVEPGDRFPSDVGSLSCFTRVIHGKGMNVVHAWIHEGHTRARVELEVGSDSWRTWSTKRILPSWTGSWEVKIMTPDGIVLESVSFTIY